MMDSILNVGINDHTVRTLAEERGDQFAYESYASFLESYGKVVLEVPGSAFDGIGRQQSHDDGRSADSSVRTCQILKDLVQDIAGSPVPQDAALQLRECIAAVARSFETERSIAYRSHEQIADSIKATAVTVQAMVFGNADARSGAGVAFSRDPSTGRNLLYGDFVLTAQGEEVVAGRAATLPLNELQVLMPEQFDQLSEHLRTLEIHFKDVVEVEFTIESGALWLLQVRVAKRSAEAAAKIAVDLTRDPLISLSRAEAVRRGARALDDERRRPTVRRPDPHDLVLTRGLPACPGVAIGRAAFTADAAISLADRGHDVILIRNKTSPADLAGLQVAEGLLTAKGGLASHAAVVARGWGKPCVTGAAELTIQGDSCHVGTTLVAEGALVSIDGATGEVLLGGVRVEDSAPSPDVEILRGWAADRDSPGQVLDIGVGPEPGALQRVPESRFNFLTLHVVGLKGRAEAHALSAASGIPVGEIERLLVEMSTAGLVAHHGGSRRGWALTAEGVEALDALREADSRKVVDPEVVLSCYEGFLRINPALRGACLDWQVREGGVNDHQDAEYDAMVLDRVAVLHRGALTILQDLEVQLPRFASYADRLNSAMVRTQNGDHAWFDSPLLDSYHSIWFELHEDLLIAVGRTREDEAN
jgi:pyruvate,orthophosphate dikinase